MHWIFLTESWHMIQVMGSVALALLWVMTPGAPSNRLLSPLMPAPVQRLAENGPGIVCPNTTSPVTLDISASPPRTQAPWSRDPECAVFISAQAGTEQGLQTCWSNQHSKSGHCSSLSRHLISGPFSITLLFPILCKNHKRFPVKMVA